MQDVLVQSFQKIEALKIERAGALQAYMRQAVLNRIRDEFRRARRRPETGELDSAHPADGASPLEAAIGRESVERYEAALAALRPGDRDSASG